MTDPGSYVLAEEQLRQRWNKLIQPLLFTDAQCSTRPKVLFVGAQPGAGKTQAILDAERREPDRDFVRLDSDELRKFHPALDGVAQTFNVFDQRSTSAALGTSVFAGTTNTERTAATGGGFTTAFANSLFGSITRTTGGPSGTTEYVRDNTGNLIAIQNGGVDHYYTTDNIGSVIALTSTAGVTTKYVYDPWGNTATPTVSAAIANKFRYAAGWTENDGTVQFGARWYNPTTGRFDQPDPSGQETNNYLYAAANPITNTDITGLFWKELGATAFGLTVGLGVMAVTDSPIFAYNTGLGAAVAWTGLFEGAPIGEVLTGFLVDSTS
ncbi:RHS repeat-associated core domain-containing protein [Nakamurella antarctica]|uniref:RHS repeat-associated core domain-containing protein n=1 Tax=Nakamurella antarctica TaxID=1902245 RepID=UPI0013DDBFE4|nr:RHS repeat-associated core domain-containing protein [Nakamurella antarctica]